MATQAEIMAGLDAWVPGVQTTAGALDQFKQKVKVILSADSVLNLTATQKAAILTEWEARYDAHVAAFQKLARNLATWDIPEVPKEPVP